MAKNLMEKLPDIFSVYFLREGVVQEIENLIDASLEPPNLLSQKVFENSLSFLSLSLYTHKELFTSF